MNLASQSNEPRPQQSSTREPRGILYGMLVLAVPVWLPLGMVVAAIGAWFALQGGSLGYLSVALGIVLAGLAVVRSHSIADFILLVMLVFAVLAWSISGADSRTWMLGLLVELSGRIDLLLGLLLILVLALSLVLWRRTPVDPPATSVR
ncbi:MAG: hypothetical protein RQ741_11070 [Wenzhouxiangellaceae bacterium]|nr:hypothetical protein [Wenzhouxiangellaceae bacterium]